MLKLSYSFLFFILFLLASCQTRKKLVYFQKEMIGEAQTNFTPTLKTDDFISIIVAGDNPEVVAVFNLPPILGNAGNVNNGYVQGNNEKSGYLIDANGNIQLPILGSIEIAGLNRMEATEMLREKLKAYVNNPVVNIQILNFKVTVLGEVKKPGSFKVPNERITILEAIGLAGDLKITGVRNNVLVIRDNNGKKQEFRVNLTENTLFNSPVYYLQQNDVVYIEPNAAARSNSTIWKTTGSVFISLTSLIITTITLISSK
ncbi:MAG: polysaccharide biosynthesis/export family protein [Crocinitomicaceae bacterium]|nr:polysaccharide biosynthesis/export family protein [Crocinitomicaceae bacterium]MDG1776035.1 polysaccharide biosynthesis/export family protein [Crocinitomicaceae bacterium]